MGLPLCFHAVSTRLEPPSQAFQKGRDTSVYREKTETTGRFIPQLAAASPSAEGGQSSF